MPLDPALKAKVTDEVGQIADRLLDSEAASLLTELPWLARVAIPHIVPWAKRALRRALGNALDTVAAQADGARSSAWLASALKALADLLEPAHASLAAARFGDPS